MFGEDRELVSKVEGRRGRGLGPETNGLPSSLSEAGRLPFQKRVTDVFLG